MTIRKVAQWVLTALAFVGAILVIVSFALPFFSQTASFSSVIFSGSGTLTVTGFAYAFGGTSVIASSSSSSTYGDVSIAPGILSAFILAVLGLVLLVVHLVFSYGKTPVLVKKGLAVVIFLVFGALTGLLFSTLPLVGEDASSSSSAVVDASAGLGSGAILGGVFSAVVALLALLSAVVAPDTAK